MMNPFEEHTEILLSDYGAAQRLKMLALHLYNSADWQCDLPFILRSTDEKHREIAFSMLRWYQEHGENCPVFMKLARELADSE